MGSHQGTGAGGDEDAPSHEDVPDFFFPQGPQLVPAYQKAGAENGNMEERQDIVQGAECKAFQKEGGRKEGEE